MLLTASRGDISPTRPCGSVRKAPSPLRTLQGAKARQPDFETQISVPQCLGPRIRFSTSRIRRCNRAASACSPAASSAWSHARAHRRYANLVRLRQERVLHRQRDREPQLDQARELLLARRTLVQAANCGAAGDRGSRRSARRSPRRSVRGADSGIAGVESHFFVLYHCIQPKTRRTFAQTHI